MEQESIFVCAVGVDFEKHAAVKILERCQSILDKNEFVPNSTLVVDMTETEHFSHDAASTLLALREDTLRKGGKIILICSPRVFSVINLMFRKEKILELFPKILRASPHKAISFENGKLIILDPTEDKRIYTINDPQALSILHSL